MNTSDRRYQIFISSTFRDLKPQRKKAIEMVFESGHIPIAMERFSASNDTDLELIAKVIRQCQVYILILGHRYGELIPEHYSLPSDLEHLIQPGERISYTELEYRIAKDAGLIILAFLMREDERDRRRRELRSSVIRDNAEIANFERMTEFHRSIQQYRCPWSSREEFKALVLKALVDNLTNCDRPGFVFEHERISSQIRSAVQVEFISNVVEKIQSFDKLYERILEHQPEKVAAARLFCQEFLDQIVVNEISLFIESGSSNCYVAREIAPRLASEVRIGDHGNPNIEVKTNNVLAYLQLWLTARVACTTFPWSPPSEDVYGAIYGQLGAIERRNPDYFDSEPLDNIALREIRRLAEMEFTLTHRPKTLMLGAIEGLQLSNQPRLLFPDGFDANSQKHHSAAIAECRGPHVASYHNKIFKRFMYSTKLPLVIMMTGEKVDRAIEVEASHFILDRDFSWDEFKTSYPLAFCVGCRQDDRDRVANAFRDEGFQVGRSVQDGAVTAFLAKNAAFAEGFGKLLNLSP